MFFEALVIIGIVLFVILFVAGWIALWMIAVCWVLAQFGFVFSGFGLIIPFAICVVLSALLGGGTRRVVVERK